MTGRRLPVTQRLAKTLIRAAKDEGGVVELVTPAGTFRFSGADDGKPKSVKPVDAEMKGYL